MVEEPQEVCQGIVLSEEASSFCRVFQSSVLVQDPPLQQPIPSGCRLPSVVHYLKRTSLIERAEITDKMTTLIFYCSCSFKRHGSTCGHFVVDYD